MNVEQSIDLKTNISESTVSELVKKRQDIDSIKILFEGLVNRAFDSQIIKF